MNTPKLACCNFIQNTNKLREYALDYGFSGIDWTFTPDDLPSSDEEEKELVRKHKVLNPIEIRYHLYFLGKEIGRKNQEHADHDRTFFYRACRLISRLGGRHVTLHIGLDRQALSGEISWQTTVTSLSNLTDFARGIGLRVCLENLAWGWTSRPDLFEKLLRKAECWGTLDIGHARASQTVISGAYDLEDFAYAHPGRILNAHVYHEETSNQHTPPTELSDIEWRLRILTSLPLCDWWVLELREHRPLVKTLRVVREFLMDRQDLLAG